MRLEIRAAALEMAHGRSPYNIKVFYARFNIPDIIDLSILAFVITLIGALYHAILAARMEPTDPGAA